MKQLTILLFIFLATSCATKKADTNNLNGTWVPIKQEMGGTELPAKGFENQTLTISDSNYTVVAESVDKGIVRCKDDKMDIYGKDGVNAGKHMKAIYKYENDQLTICYNLSDDSYPASFETKGKQMYFMAVFKKQAAK